MASSRDSKAAAVAAKGGASSSAEDAHGWRSSSMDEKKIQALVADGVLADRQMISWRPAAGHEFPSPEVGEVIVFDPFFYRGFSLPAHPFLKGLLAFYGISLHHLNPSSILHISTFIHLYEAFLGIFPHFNFFRANFFLKPQPSLASPISKT